MTPAPTCAGEMAEWLKAHAWKACLGETLTWVRIPLSPPVLIAFIDLSAIHTVVRTVKLNPRSGMRCFRCFPIVSTDRPQPVRSLALLIFAPPKLAKELPDFSEFC